MRALILIIMIILFAIGYFKVCYAIDDKKKSRILYVFLMVFLFGLSISINFMLISQQEDYEKEIKNLKKGFPQYEKINESVYILKKK